MWAIINLLRQLEIKNYITHYITKNDKVNFKMHVERFSLYRQNVLVFAVST